MSGYRVHGFDPNAYEQPGPPIRPYNWVQWTGVAMFAVGLVLIALDLLGRFGWIPQWIDSPAVTFILPLTGVTLINSRRQPAHDVAPELAAERKRWLIVIGLVCFVILGAAAFVDLAGAAQ